MGNQMFREFRLSVSPAAWLPLPVLAVLALGAADPAHAQTVTLSLSSPSIAEDGGTATVTATVMPVSTTAFTVDISTRAHPAGNRVSQTGTRLSFAANEPSSTGTVTIRGIDNSGHAEPGASVTVSGTVTGGTRVTGPMDVELNIVEDDGIGTSADRIRPTVDAANSTVNGARVVLDFSENLNTAITPAAGQFGYRIGMGKEQTPTGVEVMGDKVNLTLPEPVESTDAVSVRYGSPMDGNGDIDLTKGLQDTVGNPVYSTTYHIVTNNTPERVNLVLTPGTIEETGGVSTVTATIEEPVKDEFTVTVAVTPRFPATDDDFTVSANKVLTFPAGATESTGEVTITAVDNDREQGHKRLTVSGTLAGTMEVPGPLGKTLTIRDDEAPDLDRNASVQRAWLARFGRAAAGHVLDNVQDRLKARRGAGLRARVAGRAIGGAPPDPGTAAFASRPVSERDFLTGSAVALTGARGDGGSLALWGRGAHSGFGTRDGVLRIDGDLTTASIGADYAARRWLLGLALSHSWSEGEYRDGVHRGRIETALTGAYPYIGFAATDRLSLWGVAGYGQGTLAAIPAGYSPLEADMSLSMAGGGARGVVLQRTGPEGPQLSIAGEAVFVSASSDDGPGFKGADAETSLLRVGLDGSWAQILAGGATLTPSVDIGLRRDGGDAETGFGVEVGGGIAWTDSAKGLSLGLNARALVAHEAEGVEEWGLSGSLRFNPSPGSGRGASLTLTPSWGADRPRPSGIAPSPPGAGSPPRDARLDADFGYGLPALAGRFTGTPYLGIGLSRDARQVRAGWRLTQARSGAAEVTLRLEAARHDRAGAAAEHVTGLRFALRR